MDDQNASVGRKKMSEEGTSKIRWITQWTQAGDGKKADWYSTTAVCVVLRGWREIINDRDSIGGSFIWRHLSALLLFRNQSFMFCACMSASNICFFPVLPFAVSSLRYYPAPALESWFFFFCFLSCSSMYPFEIFKEGKLLQPVTSMFITQACRGAGWSLKSDNVYEDVVSTDSSRVWRICLFLSVDVNSLLKCSVPGCVPVMRASDPEWRGQIGLEGFLRWVCWGWRAEVGSCLPQKPRWRPQFVLVNNYPTTMPP